ncbi:MAG: hypothetical protein HUJ96_05995 [Marinilabiliaceae bacterium]|nr:hypothetical protein [Marinilabiliaceae bacterium]
MYLIEKLKRVLTDLINSRIEKLQKEVQYDNRRLQIEQNILHCDENGTTDTKYCDHNIIVSLTTYGKRLHDVAIAIESIMEQTMKANRIVLWLDEGLRDKVLPNNLQLLQKRGLEIEYCKDLRSYKKLIPSLRKFPNDAIITVDDDLIYHYDMLEPLIVSHVSNPDTIFFHRMHKITFDYQGNLKPYNEWEYLSKDDSQTTFVFFTSGGGTIFPPHCFDDEVLREDIFLDICKFADDVWWNAMALRSEVKRKCIKYTPSDCFLLNCEAQSDGLFNVNVLENKNDEQIKSVFSRYSLYEKLL